MKGSPVFQFLVVVVVVVVVGVLVGSVTGPRDDVARVVVPVSGGEPVGVFAEASAMVRFEAAMDGRVILEGPLDSGGVSQTVQLPAEGADLVVSAEGPGERFALRLLVTRDGGTLADRTFWGEGRIHEVLPLPAP
jgi:hypothetical protein